MSVTLEYDDEQLWKLLEELEPKRRVQAMRGAFRKLGYKMRKVAKANLRKSVKGANATLTKGIRVILSKKEAAVRVTVGTGNRSKGGPSQGFYKSRRIRDPRDKGRPVLLWLEEGTAERRTRIKMAKKYKSHSTGQVRPKVFMHNTKLQMRSSATEDLRKEIEGSIIRMSKKYGCK